MSPGEWAFIMMPPGTNNRVHFVSPARGNNGADGRRRRRKGVVGDGGGGGRKGGLRETASGPHRHLDSAAMFFCSLIKQPRGRKRRRLPREREEARWRRKRRKTDERREDGRESLCLEVE